MTGVLAAARRLDKTGRIDLVRMQQIARALLTAEKVVEVARQYNIPDLVAAVAEYDAATK